MKSIKKLVLSLALIIGGMALSNAQSKIAHINIQQLMTEMPEFKTAQAELKKLEATYAQDLQDSQKELQAQAKAFEQETATLTDAEIEARKAEFEKKAQKLQTMGANIQEAQNTAVQELQKKRQEKLMPILTKVQEALEKVAAAQGYDYVLDNSQGGQVLVARGKDLTEDVKKELGI